MRKWMTLLAILGPHALSSCSGAHGAPDASSLAVPAAPQPRLVPAPTLPAAPSPAELRLSRTIEDDPDADGIANYRVVITDTFDAAGNIVSTLREEDFEADGIIDARHATYIDAPEFAAGE